MSDRIKTVETYRGVGIHDCQPRDRIEAIVKPAIDHIFAIEDPSSLFGYLEDFQNPPEARLLAHARLEALFQIAAQDRWRRPTVNMEIAGALVAGLNSRGWRCPRHYGSMLNPLVGLLSQWECIERDPISRQEVDRDREALHDEEHRRAHG